MTGLEIGLLSLMLIMVLVYVGMWIPFALMIASYLGVWFIKGSPALAGKLIALAATDALTQDVFAIIPLFILLGYLAAAAGIGDDAFELSSALFRRLPGGLGVGTVGANASFAAVTGVSVASAVVFTRVALPSLLRYGYDKRFALGLIAGASALGMLIPPSLLLILYAILADQSVGELFMAGVLPGLMLAIALALMVVGMACCCPHLVMAHDSVRAESAPLPTSAVIKKAVPLFAMIVVVLGGIQSGVFTTREAAAVGCMFVLVVLVLRGRCTFGTLKAVLSDTAAVTASICFLIVAAQIYARMLSISGVPGALDDVLTAYNLGPFGFLIVYAALLIALGTMLDSASVMIVAVPLGLPFAQGLDIDLVWMGIVTVLAVEIGLLTPPFGMSVFAIKSALDDPDISLSDIFWGVSPFIGVMLVVLGAVIVMPGLTDFPNF